MNKEPSMAKRRRGKIEISMNVLRSTSLETMGKALEGMVVWHLEARHDMDTITYFAEHPDFELIDDGEMTPEYHLSFSESDGRAIQPATT